MEQKKEQENLGLGNHPATLSRVECNEMSVRPTIHEPILCSTNESDKLISCHGSETDAE